MEYEYTKKFEQDLERYKNNAALIRIIGKKIQHIIRAGSLDEIQELVSIRKKISRYRIKIRLSDNKVFRIGIVVLKNTVWYGLLVLIRIRKDFINGSDKFPLCRPELSGCQ